MRVVSNLLIFITLIFLNYYLCNNKATTKIRKKFTEKGNNSTSSRKNIFIKDILIELFYQVIGRMRGVEVNMMTGRVKWFNNDKGYGFIGFRENEDIFVHYSAIELEGYKTLSENQLVEFKLIETSKGYQAINVRLLKETTTV